MVVKYVLVIPNKRNKNAMALYAFDGTWNRPDYDFTDGNDTSTNVFRFTHAYSQCHGEDGSALKG